MSDGRTWGVPGPALDAWRTLTAALDGWTPACADDPEAHFARDPTPALRVCAGCPAVQPCRTTPQPPARSACGEAKPGDPQRARRHRDQPTTTRRPVRRAAHPPTPHHPVKGPPCHDRH